MNIVAGVVGDKNLSEEQSAQASIGSYSYTASDISKQDGSHVKTLSVLKSFGMPSHELSLDIVHSAQRPAMGRTTVEFWPPDMDKAKFYSMKKDLPSMEMEMWPRIVKKQELKETATKSLPEEAPEEVQVKIIKPLTKELLSTKELPSHLPDIPTKISSWKHKAEINDFEPLTKATESTIIDDSGITNIGPVVFPTNSGSTTKSPDRIVAYISRGNNKKRKLKKKVKPALQESFAEISETTAPSYPNSVIETTQYNQILPQEPTPIYEVINEPPQDIFQPIRYIEVISNLSNLTEQSFGMKRTKAKKKNQIVIIENPVPIESISPNDFTATADSNATEIGNQSITMSDNFSPTNIPVSSSSTTTPQSIDDLMPLEKFFNELKQAIDDRDLEKIKNIVRLMESGSVTESMEIQSSTTEAVTEASSSAIPTTTIESTTAARKVYLAPRVRKLKLAIEKASEEKLKESTVTVTVEAASTTSSTELQSATEKMPIGEAFVATSLKPTRRRRNGRSHITPRYRNIAERSRQAAKNNIRRRFARKPL